MNNRALLTQIGDCGSVRRRVVSLPARPAPPGHQRKEATCHSNISLKNWSPTLAATLLLVQVVQAEPVNINTADATALAKALNGIGPAKAKAIVSYREKNGPFKSVDQLAMVEGITQKLIDKNRADIRLGGGQGRRAGGGPRRQNRPSRLRKRRPTAAGDVKPRKLSRLPDRGPRRAVSGGHGMVSAPR